MIVKKDNKWLVMDSSGKKVLGTHYSKEEANDQLAAIEISKKRRSKVEESQNLLNNSMTNLTEYYKKLCEDLKIQRMVLEAKVKEEKEKKHKKGKKADKDYDGDGKVESGSEEYLGSRSNAIKKAVAKREGKNLKETKIFEANDSNDPALAFSPNDTIEDRIRKTEEKRRREKAELAAMRQKGEEVGGVPAHEPNPSPPPPPNNEQDELAAMRRKAEEIGGIPMPDSGDNLPGMDLTAQTPEQIDKLNQSQSGTFGKPKESSSLPGIDLTQQTPEQIDKLNQSQSGKFGKPTTTGIARQPKSMSNVPTASPEAGKMMRPYAGDGLRKPSSKTTDTDLAQKLLNYVSGRKEGKVRDSSGKLVDRDSQELVRKLNSPNSNNLFGTVRQSKPTLYADLMNGARRKMPGMNMFARMEEETNFKIDPNKSLVEATTKQLSDKQITPIDHLTYKNNTKIQLSENMIYGGFPQIKKA